MFSMRYRARMCACTIVTEFVSLFLTDHLLLAAY